MPCSVVCHHFTHVVVESLSVLSLSHVDVVDNNNATHVAQAQLTGNFIGSTQIDIERISFLAR